jgi:hypothetical protein
MELVQITQQEPAQLTQYRPMSRFTRSGNQVRTQLPTTVAVLLVEPHLQVEVLRQVAHIRYQLTVVETLLRPDLLLLVGALEQMAVELHTPMQQQL